MPSFFDDLFAGGPRAVLDAAFGQPWTVEPMAKPPGSSTSSPDPVRPVVEGITGILADKTEMFRPTHAYDQQAAQRPGIVTAEITVEFPDTFAGAPLDVRGGDVAVRLSDASRWRISALRRDVVTNRITCTLGRLS